MHAYYVLVTCIADNNNNIITVAFSEVSLYTRT